MPKAKPASLAADLVIPEKGKAEPSTSTPKGTQDTIAITVRVDQDRYVWIKTHGAQTRMTNQQIMIRALDAYRKSIEGNA
jgi:hypothetical protein